MTMAPHANDKAKAAGISASSHIDLQAEIARKRDEFDRNKASGKTTYVVGAVRRTDKKVPKFNAGVQARAARDIESEENSRHKVDDAYVILKRKAEKYEKMARGKSGGLSNKQYDQILVDFDQKRGYDSDSDVDESLTVPQPPHGQEDDPVIDYEDEFGRTRSARLSEIPRHLLPHPDQEQEEGPDPDVIYNPEGIWRTYDVSEERQKEIQAKFAEENNPLNVHYDASHEVRAKGAGFYQFSGDQETRQQQMDELRQAREETQRTRQEHGAEDVRPGEIEGMHAEEEPQVASGRKSSAMEKRKRDIEERRRALAQAKRRKLDGKDDGMKEPPIPGDATKSASDGPSKVVDAFAALEAQAQKKVKIDRVPHIPVDADAFLAGLDLPGMVEGGGS